ncbi:hypothetical protein B5C34_08435 [Pacificimonas flava]|uniref:Endonuclease/exonuclease/phosphatase domain-containing protein n=1 Tax=Pacificimonas flava TaxID=1234595 RepID=A0A219B8I1_9SPHN|nr:hypothetical protein B5C34_08435 [Pacificimonas flava]
MKAKLRAEVHGSSDERSLRLATWNLMHFGNGGAYRRTPESMLYIGEIIDHFDLVAVQEVNRDLGALERLVERHLGPAWDYIVTDTSGANKGGDAGNDERLAFLYRKAKVTFRKEAGEVVLPEGQEIAAPGSDTGNGEREVQFARTPFSVAFQSGWFKFKLVTVHIFYGDKSESSPEMEQRRREIHKIAGFLAERQELEQTALINRAREDGWDEPQDAGRAANYLLLGDFNIVSPEHHTMQALKDAGFEVPTELDATNLSGTHHYDQIALKAADPRFEFIRSGVFDMFDAVYRGEDAAHYVDIVKPDVFEKNSRKQQRSRAQKERYYKTYYRRHQMSDHKLLWCALKVDYSDDYLNRIVAEGGD